MKSVSRILVRDSLLPPLMLNSCCCPFSREAMAVKLSLPIFISLFKPNRPWLEPPNITYLVDGREREILPASMR